MTKIEGNPWLDPGHFQHFRGLEVGETSKANRRQRTSSRVQYPGSQVNEPLKGAVLNFSDTVEIR